jgi:hypothetical protein
MIEIGTLAISSVTNDSLTAIVDDVDDVDDDDDDSNLVGRFRFYLINQFQLFG